MIKKILIAFCLITLIGCASAATVTTTTLPKIADLANGQRVVLTNYNDAKIPTWAELKVALKTDRTESNIYNKKKYKCTNYAQTLHNNLEKNHHIKAGVVIVMFNATDGHALNCVQTSDKGLVLIDDCGKEGRSGVDCIAIIKIKRSYEIRGIFNLYLDYANRAPVSYKMYW